MRVRMARMLWLPWLLAATMIQGCGSLPLEYTRLDESQVIAPATLAEIEAQQLPRADVVARLGTPDYSDSLAVAYVRCAAVQGKKVTVIFFVPVWVFPGDVTECQLTGIWFGGDGRSIKAGSCRGRSDLLAEIYEWLSKPGGAYCGAFALLQTTRPKY